MLEIEGRPPQTFKAGQVYQELPGVVHNFKNASTTEPAKAINTQKKGNLYKSTFAKIGAERRALHQLTAENSRYGSSVGTFSDLGLFQSAFPEVTGTALLCTQVESLGKTFQ